MPVIEVNESAEFKKLIASGPAVVDFSATWCGPCKRVEPVFKELAKSNKDIKFIRVDIDDASETMPNELLSVNSVPTFKFFYDGKLIESFSGANLSRIHESIGKLKKLHENKTEADENSETKKPKTEKDDTHSDAKSSKSDEENKENKVIHVSKQEEYKKLISSGIKTVVDFSASWCFPCKMIAPVFNELAKKNPTIQFLKVDIDEAADELENVLNEISGVPTFYFYASGKLNDKMSGANVKTLVDKLAKLDAIIEEKNKEAREEKNGEKEEEKSNEPNKEEQIEIKPKEEDAEEDKKVAMEEKRSDEPQQEEKKEISQGEGPKVEEELEAGQKKHEEEEEEKANIEEPKVEKDASTSNANAQESVQDIDMKNDDEKPENDDSSSPKEQEDKQESKLVENLVDRNDSVEKNEEESAEIDDNAPKVVEKETESEIETGEKIVESNMETKPATEQNLSNNNENEIARSGEGDKKQE